jgi:hypothetical protein
MNHSQFGAYVAYVAYVGWVKRSVTRQSHIRYTSTYDQ